MSKFIEITPQELDGNVFHRIGRQWMLVTAGDRQTFNTMTASWGGMGVLWNTEVSMIYIRPERYTYEFLEKETDFSLSFLSEGHRQALQFCGSRSGRDTDKVKEAGLTPVFDAAVPYFAEAEISLICRKVLSGSGSCPLPGSRPCGELRKGRSHRMYVGEIQKVLKRVER